MHAHVSTCPIALETRDGGGGRHLLLEHDEMIGPVECLEGDETHVEQTLLLIE